jgi:hypothetical protein
MGSNKIAKQKGRERKTVNPAPDERRGTGAGGKRKASGRSSGGEDHEGHVQDGEDARPPPAKKATAGAADAGLERRAGAGAAGSDAGLEASGRRSGDRDREIHVQEGESWCDPPPLWIGPLSLSRVNPPFPSSWSQV